MLAVSGGSGFIGGIIAGFLAGYVAKLISTKLKLPPSMEALKPISIIPLVSSLIVGLAMIYLIGKPVAGILAGLTHWLQTMGTANAVLLGAILGAMMCTDMGGPGEQSSLCLRRRSAEYPNLRTDGGDYGGRYGATAGNGYRHAGCPQ